MADCNTNLTFATIRLLVRHCALRVESCYSGITRYW